MHCHDLPKWTEHTRLVAMLNCNVSAQLFHPTAQPCILLPPSVDDDGFVYQWTVFGEIPTHKWVTLQSWFHFQVFRFEKN
jgi:hypothetical protein